MLQEEDLTRIHLARSAWDVKQTKSVLQLVRVNVCIILDVAKNVAPAGRIARITRGPVQFSTGSYSGNLQKNYSS